MLICLLRHGIAEDAGPDTDYRDAPRRLTDEGTHRIEAEARGLQALGLAPDVVLHSPLVRCVQTATIVAAALDVPAYPDPALSMGDADLRAVRNAVAGHPDAECVLICGHQPDMSVITHQLTGGDVAFGKGAMAVIEVDAGARGRGVLRAMYPPRALRRLGGGT